MSGRITRRICLCCTLLLCCAASAAGAARTLGKTTTSGFGVDNGTSTWLIASGAGGSQGVAYKEMVTCPTNNYDSTAKTCVDGNGNNTYLLLIQMPYAPDDLSVTFGGLSGYGGPSSGTVGLFPCLSGSTIQTSIALCSPNPPNSVNVDATGDTANLTLAFGGGQSFFPTGGLTFSIGETTSQDPTTLLPTVTVNSGHSGVSLSQTALAFGSQPAPSAIGDTVSQFVILTNGGLSNLNVSKVAVSGRFSATSDCVSKSPLAQNATCSISVSFSPSEFISGLQTGTVTITDDAPSGSQVISLSGTADPSAITLTPSTLFFGAWPVSTPILTASAAPQQGVIVTNTSASGTIQISSVTAGGDACSDLTSSPCFDGTATPPSSTCSIGGSISAGGSCVVEVSVLPTVFGFGTGTITITDSSAATHIISVNEFGTSPEVSLSPANLGFSDETLGNSSSASSAALSATPPFNVVVSSIVSAGSFSTGTGTSACADGTYSTLACNLYATFTPTVAGLQMGEVILTDNIGNGEVALALGGVGLGPLVSLSPQSLYFGSQTINVASASQSIVVKNVGTAALAFSSFSASGDFAVVPVDSTCSTGSQVAMGSNCVIAVQFTPTVTGPRKSLLTIADNAPEGLQTVVLTGVGTATSVLPASLSFPSTAAGASSAPLTVTLKNSGTVPMNIWQMDILGANPSDFSETSTCGATLAGGNSCTVSVTFTPAAALSYSALLEFSDDAGGSPQTVALTGSGTASAAMQVLGSRLNHPSLNPFPTRISFGNRVLGVAGAGQIVTLRNTGQTNLPIRSISITGRDAGDFRESGTCGRSLDPGGKCELRITFAPRAAGASTAVLNIVGDKQNAPLKVQLKGVGIPSQSETLPQPPQVNGLRQHGPIETKGSD